MGIKTITRDQRPAEFTRKNSVRNCTARLVAFPGSYQCCHNLEITVIMCNDEIYEKGSIVFLLVFGDMMKR